MFNLLLQFTIFSKLTNLLRKINTFRPLTKDEVQTIERNEAHFNDQDDQHLIML